MKNLFMAFSVLLSIRLCFGGELFDLYKTYFPEQLLLNKKQVIQVEKQLRFYGRLDPELLYYYINNIDLWLYHQILDPDSNLTNTLLYKTMRAKKRLNAWNDAQAEKIREKAIPYIEQNALIAHLPPSYKTRKIDEPSYKTVLDKNKRDYYTYLFLTNDAQETYQPEKNYSSLVNRNVKKLIAEFTEAYNKQEKPDNRTKENWLAKAKKFPYLFKDSYVSGLGETTDFYYFEFVQKILKDDYSNFNYINSGITYSLLPLTYEANFRLTDTFGNTYPYTTEITTDNAAYIHLGYQYKRDNSLWAFSYLNFSIGYAIYYKTSLREDSALVYLDKKDLDSPHYYRSYRYIIHNIQLTSLYSITTQIVTPVFYLSPRFFFEAGLNYTFSNYNFSYDFYEWSYTYGQTSSIIEKENNLSESMYQHSVYPVLGVKYLPLRSVHFHLEYLIPKMLRASLSVFIKL